MDGVDLCQRAFIPIGSGRYPVCLVTLVSWVVAGVVTNPFRRRRECNIAGEGS